MYNEKCENSKIHLFVQMDDALYFILNNESNKSVSDELQVYIYQKTGLV